MIEHCQSYVLLSFDRDLRIKDDAVGISREQFFTMQANESVLMTTVEDQQLKIKEWVNLYKLVRKRTKLKNTKKQSQEDNIITNRPTQIILLNSVVQTHEYLSMVMGGYNQNWKQSHKNVNSNIKGKHQERFLCIFRLKVRTYFFVLHFRLEKTVTMLEKRNMALKDEMKSMGTEKSDKFDVVKKAEKEMKFLKNELQIKEKSLQLSMIERNELLDR